VKPGRWDIADSRPRRGDSVEPLCGLSVEDGQSTQRVRRFSSSAGRAAGSTGSGRQSHAVLCSRVLMENGVVNLGLPRSIPSGVSFATRHHGRNRHLLQMQRSLLRSKLRQTLKPSFPPVGPKRISPGRRRFRQSSRVGGCSPRHDGFADASTRALHQHQRQSGIETPMSTDDLSTLERRRHGGELVLTRDFSVSWRWRRPVRPLAIAAAKYVHGRSLLLQIARMDSFRTILSSASSVRPGS